VNKKHDAQILSSEVDALLSYRPHWIVRKGNFFFLLILVLLLVLAWFVKYPDVVRVPVYLRSTPVNYYGLMEVARTQLSKIQPGQRVLIQVDGYPSPEFGYLIGTVDSISTSPSNGDYLLVKITLPGGLETSYHKSIHFKDNLSANAGIVTGESRLLDKFISALKPH